MNDWHFVRCRRRVRYFSNPRCPVCHQPMRRGAGRKTRCDQRWQLEHGSVSQAELVKRTLDRRPPE